MLVASFALIVILCSLAYYYLLAVLHIKNRKFYHPISQAVSDYGVGEHRRYFQLAGLVVSLRTIALTLALGFWSYRFQFKQSAVLLLLLALIGYLGVAVFRQILKGKSGRSRAVSTSCLQLFNLQLSP